MGVTFTAREAGYALLETCRPYMDLVETTANAVWSDPVRSKELEAGMLRAGWKPGWPYCMASVEFLVVKTYEALGAHPDVIRLIAQKLTPHVMTSYRNCGPYARSKAPEIGAIGFMRKGETDSGHAFIATLPGERTTSTFEGNTSRLVGVLPEADRNGDGFYVKARPLVYRPTARLYLVGFLNPMGSAELEQLAGLPLPEAAP